MRRVINILVCVAFITLFAACTGFQVSNIQMAASQQSYETLGQFKTSVMVNEFIGGSAGTNLFNVTSDAMDEAINEAIQEEITNLSGDAAVNVSIVYKASFLDVLLNSFTFNLYAPAHAEITGTIVKY